MPSCNGLVSEPSKTPEFLISAYSLMQNARPFISVVIPHLNQPEGLERCLDSLGHQNYPRDRFEVIVVDNGSKSAPSTIVQAFGGARLESEDTPGPGPARNKGFAAGIGEIFAFIDADCTADNGWLNAISTFFITAPTKSIAGGDVRIALSDPNNLTMLEAYESVFAYRQKEYIERQGFSGTGNLAVRRHDLHEIGPFAGIEMAEDRDWGQRARRLGYSISFLPDMVIFHPARKSFSELYTKWDRHIVHDSVEWRRRGRTRIGWLFRTMAVAVSPLIDVVKIMRSNRIEGAGTRAVAGFALVRIRLYRALRMLKLIISRRQSGEHPTWNNG